MEQAIAQFSIFPSSPREKASFVEKCVDEIISGEKNPLEFEIMLKNLEDTISLIRKNDRVKDCVQTEARKYTEKTFEFRGFEITKSCKSTYDYSNDSTWVDLREKIKSREKLLQAINPTLEDITSGTSGEILIPPIKKQSEYLTIKYKG